MYAVPVGNLKVENFPPALVALHSTLKDAGTVVSTVAGVGVGLLAGFAGAFAPPTPSPQVSVPTTSWEAHDYVLNVLYDRSVYFPLSSGLTLLTNMFLVLHLVVIRILSVSSLVKVSISFASKLAPSPTSILLTLKLQSPLTHQPESPDLPLPQPFPSQIFLSPPVRIRSA